MPKLFQTSDQAQGALRMLDMLMRYFAKYANDKFSGLDILNVLDWYRTKRVPQDERARYDDSTRGDN